MRREKRVTITAEGRDKGKTFIVREPTADAGEWWAVRALIVMGNAGATLPANVVEAGVAGLAAMEQSKGLASALFVIGLRMFPGVDPVALRPLLDEMMTHVKYKPPGVHPEQDLADGALSQIEELGTRVKLRQEWLELLLGFSLAGAELTTDTTPTAAAPASSSTQTSPG